ncbi:hypothetical protein B0H11DRAFT_1709243 [Mycena galericulata]|nr:hypothetical protein B0H11DRAFT_1709243 [Mycena galericulata]
MGIASICVARKIKFGSDLILPWLEQLDAHDKVDKGPGDDGDGDNNGNNGNGDDDSNDGEGEGVDGRPGHRRKRSLKDRLSTPDGDDDDDEEYRAKRSKTDASSFVWRSRAQEFLESMVLTPEHQDLLQQIEIYSRDLKGAVCDLLNAFDIPALPETQWKNVLSDRFMDFDTILTSSFAVELEEPQQLVLGDSHVEIKKPKMVAKVSTHGQWINAFRTYEEAINFAFNGRARELRTYWNHINDLFSSQHSSLHPRIINYDRAARVFVGQRRDILLSEVNKFRHIQDAHLLDGGIAVTPAGPSNGGNKSKPPTGKMKKRTQEICRNYNYGRCRLANDCNYKHACLECNGGGHPASECPDKRRQT